MFNKLFLDVETLLIFQIIMSQCSVVVYQVYQFIKNFSPSGTKFCPSAGFRTEHAEHAAAAASDDVVFVY